MSERGVFAMDRGWFDHPTFKAEPFTEREAWAWLISEAAYREHTRRVGNFVVRLERGQLAASLRFLASKWQWLPARVDRFLKRLKTEAMIDTAIGTGVTVLTVCNYARYQRVSLPNDTDVATENETPARQQRYKVEDKENKEEERKGELRSLLVNDDWPSDYRQRFWLAYPRRVGKQAAMRALDTVRQQGRVGFRELMAGVERYAAAGLDPQFVKHPERWLRDGRWDDDPAALARAGPQPIQPRTMREERKQVWAEAIGELSEHNHRTGGHSGGTPGQVHPDRGCGGGPRSEDVHDASGRVVVLVPAADRREVDKRPQGPAGPLRVDARDCEDQRNPRRLGGG